MQCQQSMARSAVQGDFFLPIRSKINFACSGSIKPTTKSTPSRWWKSQSSSRRTWCLRRSPSATRWPSTGRLSASPCFTAYSRPTTSSSSWSTSSGATWSPCSVSTASSTSRWPSSTSPKSRWLFLTFTDTTSSIEVRRSLYDAVVLLLPSFKIVFWSHVLCKEHYCTT